MLFERALASVCTAAAAVMAPDFVFAQTATGTHASDGSDARVEIGPLTQTVPITPPPRGLIHVRVSSDGEPVDVAFVPYWRAVPPDDQLSYVCRTPCDHSLEPGTYNVVARSDAGRVRQPFDARADSELVVTPRRSLAPGVALLSLGGVSAAAGFGILFAGLGVAAVERAFGISHDLSGYFIAASVCGAIALAALIPGGILLRGTRGRIRRAGDPIAFRGTAIAPIASGGVTAGAVWTF